jgi:hypothetical protein
MAREERRINLVPVSNAELLPDDVDLEVHRALERNRAESCQLSVFYHR